MYRRLSVRVSTVTFQNGQYFMINIKILEWGESKEIFISKIKKL